MSKEQWSGDMADFEAAAARCPFLSSLGEAAIADIRAELEQVAIAPLASEEQVIPEVKPRAVSSHMPEQIKAEDSVFIPEAIMPIVAGEIHIDETVITDGIEAAHEQAMTPHIEDMLRAPVEIMQPEEILAIEVSPRLAESTADEIVPTAPIVTQQKKTVPKHEQIAAVGPPILPKRTTIEQPMNIEITDTAEPVEPKNVLPRVEMPEPLALEHISEIAQPPETAPPILQILAEEPHAHIKIDELQVEKAETIAEESPFLVQLETLVTETVEPERQEQATELITQIYELAVPLLEQASAGLEPERQEQLETAVIELLEILGVAEPTDEQIDRFIALVRTEIQTKDANDITEPYLDTGMHEHLQGLIVAAKKIHWPQHRHIGRLALVTA